MLNDEVFIQVSFQGGGAKIVDLLAAADAIQTVSSEKNVKISRLAGTSAGSIVALLLAFDIEISKLDSSLFDKILKVIRGAPGIEKLQGDGWLDKGDQLLNIARGFPFIENGYLKTIIHRLLETIGIDPDVAVKDVPKPLFIGAASQVSRKAEYFNQEVEELSEYSVVDALTASCNIPFVFTNFRSDGELKKAFVDGGLCENLPVEPLLKKRPEFGPVIAIGVISDGIHWPAKNAKEYIGQLFDIAMNNSVKRAERLVGAENVHRVSSKIGSTDFLSLDPTFRLKPDYKRTYESCSNWFSRRVDSLDTSDNNSREIPSEPTVQELLEQNQRSFELRRKGCMYKVEYSALVARPSSWKSRQEGHGSSFQELDTFARVHLVPRQDEFELNEYPIGITAIDESWVVPPSLNVEIVQQNGDRRPAKFEIFRYSLEAELFGYRKQMIKCVVVLDEPLAKSSEDIEDDQADKILIWYQQQTELLFVDLENPEEEYDSLSLFAAKGINAKIDNIFLLICGDSESAKIKISQDEHSCPLKKLAGTHELPVELAYLCDPEVPFHGWISEAVNGGEGARLRLENAEV